MVKNILSGINYFGGEVAVGSINYAFQSNTFSHTGKFSLKLQPSQYGFVYRGLAGTDFVRAKRYTTSVWIHQSNAAAGRLYCNLKDQNGNSISFYQTDVSQSNTLHMGNWYLLTLEVDIPVSTQVYEVEFGTSNVGTSGVIYMDDFQVHPFGSQIHAYVYDAHTGLLTNGIGTDQIGIRYTYNNAGALIRTDKETSVGFKRVSDGIYYFSKQ